MLDSAADRTRSAIEGEGELAGAGSSAKEFAQKIILFCCPGRVCFWESLAELSNAICFCPVPAWEGRPGWTRSTVPTLAAVKPAGLAAPAVEPGFYPECKAEKPDNPDHDYDEPKIHSGRLALISLSARCFVFSLGA